MRIFSVALSKHKRSRARIDSAKNLLGVLRAAFGFVFISVFASALTLASVLVSTAYAQSFSAVVSPPRFAVTVQPGKTIRQVIEITQASSDKGRYRVYTNDWIIGADGNAVFSDELAPNSCRPWVSLERKELTIAANGKVRFRFEIAVPANSSEAECRFAVMIEGTEQVIKTEGALSFPVSGRIGVVVYATVGDAAPVLDITKAGVSVSDGVQVPTLSIKNNGNAHGRPIGFLKGVDAGNQSVDFSPEALPILPGQTRAIRLIPQLQQTQQTQQNTPIKLVYPVTIKGAVEWSESPNSKKTEIDFRFDAPTAATTPVSATPASKAQSNAPADSKGVKK